MFHTRILLTAFVSLVGLLGTHRLAYSQSAGAEPVAATSDGELEKLLEPIRAEHKSPGLVAGIVGRTGLVKVAAVGLRKAGAPERLTVNDRFHLGSDTKAMTATHLALLVEQGKLRWDSTLAELFPRLQADLHPDFQSVTISQLLLHQAGIQDDGSFFDVGNGTVIEQRDMLMKRILGRAPAHPPGSKFVYSNTGYIVAGHVVEELCGKSWEEQIAVDLFQPLGMTTVGYGFPGTKDQVDQPWGHKPTFGTMLPLQIDNPPVLGPAGRVHCSPADWARFIALHLNGARGTGMVLKPETFQKLHTPPAGSDYALGWGRVAREWAGGNVLLHSGSNTVWYATVVIAPEKDLALFAIANAGPPNGQSATAAALAALIEQTAKPPAAVPTGAAPEVPLQFLKTPRGTRFGIVGPKPPAPAPLLFVFANDIRTTLQGDSYNKIGRLLSAQGAITVAIDLPCHGENVVAGEPAGLDGWAHRLRNGSNPVTSLVADATDVVDYLIAEKFADPSKVFACGTSRGGFSALHFAAADPRVRSVAAFAPVTDLPALTEFKNLADDPTTMGLALLHQSQKLAGRPIWMCIGNHDERVDTERAIAFSRAVVKAAVAAGKPAAIELHVMTSLGHRTHPTAHDEAAAWMASQLK
ncbi:MAG: serine hydrolase [Planctomycetes bacterium]|nr:serine hydrolase [Planctomycetota bacterium]